MVTFVITGDGGRADDDLACVAATDEKSTRSMRLHSTTVNSRVSNSASTASASRTTQQLSVILRRLNVRVALFVIVLVIVILLVVGGSLAIVFGVLRRHGRARVLEQIGNRPVILQSEANCFGVASRGPWQVRGSGNLVLMADELRFVSWGGARDIAIPVRGIVSVDTTRSHLGKTIFRDLLRVSWTSGRGEDAVAWAVGDLDRWLAALPR